MTLFLKRSFLDQNSLCLYYKTNTFTRQIYYQFTSRGVFRPLYVIARDRRESWMGVQLCPKKSDAEFLQRRWGYVLSVGKKVNGRRKQAGRPAPCTENMNHSCLSVFLKLHSFAEQERFHLPRYIGSYIIPRTVSHNVHYVCRKSRSSRRILSEKLLTLLLKFYWFLASLSSSVLFVVQLPPVISRGAVWLKVPGIKRFLWPILYVFPLGKIVQMRSNEMQQSNKSNCTAPPVLQVAEKRRWGNNTML